MSLRQLLKGSELELKAELQLILNAVVEGICGLDMEGNVTFCNHALLKMTGYQTEEIIGKNLHDLLHHSRPDGTKYPAEECAACRAVTTQQEAHIEGGYSWRKNGTCFPTEYWAHPLQQPSTPTAYVVTIQDLTDKHAANDVLRQSEEKFRRILANVPDVAWTSDRDGQTIYISPKVEAILGYTNREICAAGAQLWLGRIHPEDSGRVKEAYSALSEKHSAYEEEYRIRRKDGVWIWVHDRATGTREENGVLCVDGLLRDITRRKQAEAELQSKTAFLEAQANSTIDGILVVDGRGQRLLLNQRFVELFNVPPEMVANQDDRNLLAYLVGLIKDPESFMAKLHHLNNHPSETSRDEIEFKHGMILDSYSSPVVDQSGIYYGRIWTFRDITERKRAETELYESRQMLQSILDAIPQRVFWKDRDLNYLGCNRAFATDAGLDTPGAIIGKSDFDLAWAASAEIHRTDDRLVMTQEWAKLDFHERQNRPDGSVLWLQTNKLPLRDRDGKVTGIIGTYEDITERKRAEKELRLTQSSLEDASDALYWLDPQARIVYVNEAACRSLGYSREELLALSVPDIDPLFPKDAWAAFWEGIKQQGSKTFETQHQTKQGRVFPVEVTANYLEFDGQEYSFAFVRDITERRELEGQLRQAQKLEGIGQLAAGIAHEINTPTQFVTDNLTFLCDSWKSTHDLLERYRTAIRNAAETLPPGVAAALDEAEQNCDLDFIVTEVPRAIEQGLDGSRRVAKIVRAMKDFSHPGSSDKTATDLNRAIESTITVARNEWKYVAEIATEFDEALPPVVCYPGEINQVILNLIVNAAHAIKEKVTGGEKGRITVCTHRRDEYAEILISDTGTGIPEAIRNRIFDPFFTTKEVGKGTGQGLAMAHSVIVKKHRGKIWFETEPGLGTTFFVDLPIEPAKDPGRDPVRPEKGK